MAFGDIPGQEDLPRLTSSEWVCCPSLNKCVSPVSLCPDTAGPAQRMAIYPSEADCKAAGPPCGPLRPTLPTKPPDSLLCYHCPNPASDRTGDWVGGECVPTSCDSPAAYASYTECRVDCIMGWPRTKYDWAPSYDCVIAPLTRGYRCIGRDDLNGSYTSAAECREKCKLSHPSTQPHRGPWSGGGTQPPPPPPQRPEFGDKLSDIPGFVPTPPGGPSTGV